MKIFISYSSNDRDIAEKINLALIGAGHDVFFDQTSLPSGGEYNKEIRRAVYDSDIFVYLVSPDSVVQTSYALTELNYARSKWKHPENRVLPVVIRKTDFKSIPNYLKAVTLLEPVGNVPAEVVDAVNTLPSSNSTYHKSWFFLVFLIITLVLVLLLFYRSSFNTHFSGLKKVGKECPDSEILSEKINRCVDENYNDKNVFISSVKAKNSIVDVIINNQSENPIVIHDASLLVEKKTNFAYFPPETGGYIGSSYQYNIILNTKDNEVNVDMSQVIEPKSVDRFHIVLLSGVPSDDKGKFGKGISPDVRMDKYEGSEEVEELFVAGFDIKAKIKFKYNSDNYLISDSFETTVFGVWPASIVVDVDNVFSFRDRAKLLESDDCSVLFSSIGVLEQVGGDQSLKMLVELKDKYPYGAKFNCSVESQDLRERIEQGIEYIKESS